MKHLTQKDENLTRKKCQSEEPDPIYIAAAGKRRAALCEACPLAERVHAILVAGNFRAANFVLLHGEDIAVGFISKSMALCDTYSQIENINLKGLTPIRGSMWKLRTQR